MRMNIEIISNSINPINKKEREQPERIVPLFQDVKTDVKKLLQFSVLI